MRALILAAGLGTRLRPLTSVRAKAAVPVNGIPLISRAISWLVSEGIADLVVNLHHHPESIAAIVGEGRGTGARVRYSWENPVLGSAGGPRHALPLLVDEPFTRGADDTFLMVNGDTLTSLNLQRLLAEHRETSALVTMSLIPNPRPEHYGGVRVENGWVTGFTGRGSAGPSYHFIGVQAARARAFADLEDGVPAESVMGLYPRLMRDVPHSVRACILDAPFSDIGTPADYLQTSLQLANQEGNRLVNGSRIEIHPSASLEHTAVWDDVWIGADCVLEECIVADGVRVPARSRHHRTAIVPFTGQRLETDERVEGELLLRRF